MLHDHREQIQMRPLLRVPAALVVWIAKNRNQLESKIEKERSRKGNTYIQDIQSMVIIVRSYSIFFYLTRTHRRIHSVQVPVHLNKLYFIRRRPPLTGTAGASSLSSSASRVASPLMMFLLFWPFLACRALCLLRRQQHTIIMVTTIVRMTAVMAISTYGAIFDDVRCSGLLRRAVTFRRFILVSSTRWALAEIASLMSW